jgi:glycosyltransferase involved in cell wall biosynthesis
MKIFYLLSSNDSTAYYRGYLPGTFLRQMGHEVEFNIDWFKDEAYYIKPQSQEEIQAKHEFAMSSDIIVMQRPGNLRYLSEMFRLKQAGKTIVVEHDDLLDNIPALSPFSTFTLDKEAHDLILEGANMITCTTEYLQWEFWKYNSCVRVVPNGIDLTEYKAKLEPHDKFRIGLLGSVAYADNQLAFNLKEIAAIPNVQIVVMGMPTKEEFDKKLENIKAKGNHKHAKIYARQFKPFEGIANIEFHDYVTIDKYPDAVASLNLDCAVIPRDNSNFNKAKSNIKFLECAALKIPTICQHFLDNDSPYDIDYEQDNSIMLRAGWGEPSFKEQIEKLINDKDLSKQITESAYQYVQQFDIRETAKWWEDVFLQLARN